MVAEIFGLKEASYTLGRSFGGEGSNSSSEDGSHTGSLRTFEGESANTKLLVCGFMWDRPQQRVSSASASFGGGDGSRFFETFTEVCG